jgi:hypothetical protein
MFIYSLPLLFNEMNIGNPLELWAIVIILAIVLQISAPFPDESFINNPCPYSIYLYCIYAWSAQLSLRLVFWPFFILFNIGIYAADYLAKIGDISISSWDDVHFMFFFPSLLWSITVWRSSENTHSRFFATGARLMTLAVFFEYCLKLSIRSQYTPLFFNCEDKLLDYISCF